MKRFLLPFVLVALFAAHFATGWYLVAEKPRIFLQNDGQEYYELGINLAERGEFAIEKRRYYEPRRNIVLPEAYRIQIQSVLLAGLQKMKIPAPASAALLLAVAAAVSSWLMYDFAKRLCGGKESAGWIALALFQIHPLLALYSVQFGSEALFTCGILVFLRMACLAPDWKRPFFMALAGVFASLVRPTALVFLPAGICLFLLWSWLGFRRGRGWKNLSHAAIYGGVFLMFLLPLGFRNQHCFGTFSFTGHLGGFNLYVGNNRHNMEAYASRTGQDFLKHQTAGWNELLEIVNRMPPAENGSDLALADRKLMTLARAELGSMTPKELLILFGGKAWHFVRPYPMPGIHGTAGFLCMTLFDSFLLIGGISGGILLWRRKNDFLYAALMVAGSGFLAHTLVHVYMRHRVPFLIPVLILFTALTLTELAQRFAARKQHGKVLESDLR